MAYTCKNVAFIFHTDVTIKSTVNIHCGLVLLDPKPPARLGMSLLENICPRLRKSH